MTPKHTDHDRERGPMSDDCTRENEFHMHSDRCYEAGRRDVIKRLSSGDVREAVEQAANDVIADHEMWIGDDGEPLDYLPQREARIGHYIHESSAAVVAAILAALDGA